LSNWNSSWWKTLLVPGGLVFAIASFLLLGASSAVSPAVLTFYYSAVFLSSLLLAWRFHSGLTFAALTLVLLAHRAIEFYATQHIRVYGPGRTALDGVCFLLALNFVWLAAAGEFSFSVSAFAPRLGILFLESVFVALICRPQPAWGSDLFRGAWFPPSWFSWTRLSQVSVLVLVLAFVFLMFRFAISRKQSDAGFVWALAAVACGFSTGGVGRVADGYVATAGLLLLIAVIETSYRMAYHDELTGIPSRRALNGATTSLECPYTVAVVDVDHFKLFNDTHGHDTGDEVLRMVAGRLASVTGSGHAFRVGGEEFTILFPGKRVEETLPHLEELRRAIEGTRFRLRGNDRRVIARGPERRQALRKSDRGGASATNRRADDLRVTVSIGIAEVREDATFEATVERADKALYRAKQNGRNRLYVDGKRNLENTKPIRRRKSGIKPA
jgi:diguanylate cyclase (GGDEF)-like protein